MLSILTSAQAMESVDTFLFWEGIDSNLQASFAEEKGLSECLEFVALTTENCKRVRMLQFYEKNSIGIGRYSVSIKLVAVRHTRIKGLEDNLSAAFTCYPNLAAVSLSHRCEFVGQRSHYKEIAVIVFRVTALQSCTC